MVMLETKMVVDIYKDGIFQITKVLYQWILKKKICNTWIYLLAPSNTQGRYIYHFLQGFNQCDGIYDLCGWLTLWSFLYKKRGPSQISMAFLQKFFHWSSKLIINLFSYMFPFLVANLAWIPRFSFSFICFSVSFIKW